ncbi:hypothetical protein [Streptomyces sp. NPDC088725]|uniref:hypothetical protein n=1 Tax=Streptomyces sp. NPDC088725 TaxID=3365873 RepID=UPI00382845BC
MTPSPSCDRTRTYRAALTALTVLMVTAGWLVVPGAQDSQAAGPGSGKAAGAAANLVLPIAVAVAVAAAAAYTYRKRRHRAATRTTPQTGGREQEWRRRQG